MKHVPHSTFATSIQKIHTMKADISITKSRKGTETEKTGQDSSENVKDKKENPEPEKKEQKSRGQHRKEAR